MNRLPLIVQIGILFAVMLCAAALWYGERAEGVRHMEMLRRLDGIGQQVKVLTLQPECRCK